MKGWKTLVAAALIAALGVVQQSGLADLVPAEYEGLAMTIIGVLMAGLRWVTTSPVGKQS